jgi:hypothetical protein
MIISQEKEALILEEGASSETIGMSLDNESTHMLMQMLSKNLYSDPIGSTVRELASNALDSHRRAGVEGTPIIVRLKPNEQGNYEFSVEDFGVGLDDVDVREIISKYGKSTKRNSNVELGAFGLGFKSPLSYSSTFYFICRKDGMERKYMMYEGEDNNSIDLLHEHSTDQGNGVKMIVPLKSNYDRFDFIRKIRQQLAYFENVYFNVEDINNSFRIFRNEHYQWSEIANDSNLHICLDNVYYPIDFGKLNIKRIEIPVGLRFSLSDGIVPTPNRENIRYTYDVIQKIIGKIRQLCTHFITEFNAGLTETEDVLGVIDFYRNEKKIKLQGNNYKISPLEPYSDVLIGIPSIKGLPIYSDVNNMKKIVNVRDSLFTDYEVNYTYTKKKFKRENHSSIHYWNLASKKRIVIVPGELDVMSKRYLKEQWGDDTVLVVEKSSNISLDDKKMNSYVSLLELKKYPKCEWRARIQEFQKMKQMIVSKRFEDMRTFSVPQDWMKAYKENNKRVTTGKRGVKKKEVALEGHLKVRMAENPHRYNDDCKFTNETIDMTQVRKCLTVYGKDDSRSKLEKLYTIFKGVKFCIVAERNYEMLEKAKLHNWMSVEKFISKDSKHMKRAVAVQRIKALSLFQEYGLYYDTISSVSRPLANSLIELKAYVKKTNITPNIDYVNGFVEGCAMDPSIETEYLHVRRFIDKWPAIEIITIRPYISKGETVCQTMVDALKYNKCRLNHECYVKKGGQ